MQLLTNIMNLVDEKEIKKFKKLIFKYCKYVLSWMMVHWGTSKVQKLEKILKNEITVRLVHNESPPRNQNYIFTFN